MKIEKLGKKSTVTMPLTSGCIMRIRAYYNELLKYNARQTRSYEKEKTDSEIKRVAKWLAEFKQI